MKRFDENRDALSAIAQDDLEMKIRLIRHLLQSESHVNYDEKIGTKSDTCTWTFDAILRRARRLGCFVSFGCLMGAGPIYGYMGYVLPKLVQPRLSSHAARCAAFAFMT